MPLILSLFVVSSFVVAHAQSDEEMEDTGFPACEEAQETITNKILTFQAAKPEHTFTYQSLYLKTAAIAQKANILGYGTEDLYADLDELDRLIEDFDRNYTDFIEALTTAGDTACDEEEVYARNFVLAKEALGEVRQSTRNIADLYQEEIRPDILALEKIDNE